MPVLTGRGYKAEGRKGKAEGKRQKKEISGFKIWRFEDEKISRF